MPRARRLIELLLLALLSALAAVYGLGLSYPSFRQLHIGFGHFRSFSSDSWIQDGTKFSFNGLAARGNRLELSLSAEYRPALAGDVRIDVKVCDEVFAHLEILRRGTDTREGAETRTIYLSRTCEPRIVSFDVLNPWTPSARDSRKLGAQLVSARLTSAAGVPLVDFSLIAQVAAGLLVLGALMWSASGSLPAAIFVLLCAFAVLTRVEYLVLEHPIALWALCVSLIVGLWLARRTPQARSHDVASPHAALLFASIITLLGAALRVYGIRFGLPHNFHPDEVPKVNAIMRMVASGSLNPDYFLHPSFLLYSTYALNTVFHFFGMSGEFRDTAFLAGRTVSVACGSASIFLTFLIGRRLYNHRVGLLAAAGLAVFPLHVTCSRYMKEDAALLFWVLATLVVVLKSVYERKPNLLYAACFLAGIAASTKYSGMLALGLVFTAPWLASKNLLPDGKFIPPALLGIPLALLGFVLITPYSVLNSEIFLKHFNLERRHMLRGHTVTVDAWSQFWMFHFNRSIIPGMTLASTLIACAGIGFLAWRRKIEDLFVIAMVLLFYLPAEWVKAKPAPQPERYIFPCLPFLAIAAGAMLEAARFRPALVKLIAALVFIALPASRSIGLASEMVNDTRTRLTQWMTENLPHGSKIIIDYGLYGPKWFNGEFEMLYPPLATVYRNEIYELPDLQADYMVFSSLTYDRHFSLPSRDNAAIRQWLRMAFRRLPIVHEVKPMNGTYGFHNPKLTVFSLKRADYEKLMQELQADKDENAEQAKRERASIRDERDAEE